MTRRNTRNQPLTSPIDLTMTSPVRTILLFKTEGSSYKFYGLTITPDGDLFRLNYMNGPRGGSMKTKPKLADAVPLAVAQKEFDKVMKAGVDGIFTNRAAELLKFYKRWPSSSVQDLLQDNGY